MMFEQIICLFLSFLICKMETVTLAYLLEHLEGQVTACIPYNWWSAP